MSLKWCAAQYNVPAVRGRRVRYDGRLGTIVGSHNGLLKLRMDDQVQHVCSHPTWRMEYLSDVLPFHRKSAAAPVGVVLGTEEKDGNT